MWKGRTFFGVRRFVSGFVLPSQGHARTSAPSGCRACACMVRDRILNWRSTQAQSGPPLLRRNPSPLPCQGWLSAGVIITGSDLGIFQAGTFADKGCLFVVCFLVIHSPCHCMAPRAHFAISYNICDAQVVSGKETLISNFRAATDGVGTARIDVACSWITHNPNWTRSQILNNDGGNISRQEHK